MEYQELVKRALDKLPDAYVPYSGFHVAAALLCEDGTVYDGVNIENVAYTPTNCAERTAFFKAVSEGQRAFRAIAVVGCSGEALETEAYRERRETPEVTPPCGVCRQVMREFVDPDAFDIILARTPSEYQIYHLNDLLPQSFGPNRLRPRTAK